jgi:hypothetical protein
MSAQTTYCWQIGFELLQESEKPRFSTVSQVGKFSWIGEAISFEMNVKYLTFVSALGSIQLCSYCFFFLFLICLLNLLVQSNLISFGLILISCLTKLKEIIGSVDSQL